MLGQFNPRMSVIPITVFFSLGLVFFFVALFLREHRRRHFASAERDSLLPLADEQPRVQQPESAADEAPEHTALHCGCLRSAALAQEGHRGVRPPCSHCLREAAGNPIR